MCIFIIFPRENTAFIFFYELNVKIVCRFLFAGSIIDSWFFHCFILYSRKTVTWAADVVESNYKNPDTANIYESQNMVNVDENPADPYYTNQSDSQQIQQNDYATSEENAATAADTNESPHYQYDNEQYQYQAPPDASGNDYYYGTESVDQYNQYVAQPDAQPQQQEVITIHLRSFL